VDQGTADVTDRRVLRGIRNRDAVVNAVIALVGEGQLQPTAPMIAERAGVSLRSIHNHFVDLDDLSTAVSERMIENVAAGYRELPEGGTFEERLAAYVKQRATLLEPAVGMYLAARVAAPEIPAVAERVDAIAQWLRDRTVRAFRPELRGAPIWKLEALDALTSLDGWVRLRVNQRLSVAQAKRVLAKGVAAIIAAE
jgi:AcrR family transcriptional regulator